MKAFLLVLLLFSASVLRAQLNDDFTDGDLDSHPTWSGSNSGADFIVADNKLRSNCATSNASFFLSVPNTLAIEVQWEYLLHLQFNTSGSNYVDVYVISDKADLKNPLINGYFIRIGGTDDEISLFKRSGTAANSIKIIDGIDGSVASSNNIIKIRLERDENGLFTLERQIMTRESAYFKEGTVGDISFMNTSHFGVLIQQSTPSFHFKHYFDNISIVSTIDTVPPTLQSISALDSNTLELGFNEAMDSASVKTAANYLINGSSGLVSRVVATNDPAKIHLKLANSLDGETYLVSVSNVNDINGNAIDNSSQLVFTYIKPYIVKFGDVVINEIFPDPSPQMDLPALEFAELRNTTNETLSLRNWKFSDSGSSASIGDITISPHSLLIICAKADTAEYKSYGNVIGLSPWPSLNNTGELLKLINSENLIVDSIRYSDSWYRDTQKKQGGWTLEKINALNNSCNGFYNWSSSFDPSGGTPGRVNSVDNSTASPRQIKIDSVSYQSDSTIIVHLNSILDTSYLKPSYFTIDNQIGRAELLSIQDDYTRIHLEFASKFQEGMRYILSADSIFNCDGTNINPPDNQASFIFPLIPELNYPIIINEIYADPTPSFGLPDAEFIEFYNPTEKSVVLKGMSYSDEVREYKFTAGEIGPKSYLILCAEKDTLDFIPFGKVLGLPVWPALGNEREVLTLKNNKGREIHRVAFSAAWYRDNDKKGGGYSLEMIDPASVCIGIQNWQASKDTSGGTPGRRNSVYDDQPTEPLKLLEAVQVDSITFLLTFSRSVDSLSASTRSNYFINNGLGNPGLVQPLSPDFNQVLLKLNAPPAGKGTYNVKANNIRDCRGTLLSIDFNHQDLIITPRITKNDILINEVLFNPRPGGVDFVEIYNNTENLLNLQDLSIATIVKDTLSNVTPISPKQLLFKPGEYIVFTSDPKIIKKEYFSTNVPGILHLGIPSFNDDSGIVVLLSKGIKIDQLNYTEKMHFQLLKTFEGVSLERSNFSLSTNDPGNFRSATAASGYGTPAYKNSQFSADAMADSEFALASKTFSPDNDGFEDLLQVTYRMPISGMVANVKIFSDNGLLVKNLLKNSTLNSQGVFTWDGLDESNTLARVGLYIIHADIFDTNGNVKRFRKPFVLATKL